MGKCAVSAPRGALVPGLHFNRALARLSRYSTNGRFHGGAMAPTEVKPRVLIARDASDLAFRIGQAVQQSVMRKAIERATNRNVGIVDIDDVRAAASGIDVLAACQAAGVARDGSSTGKGSNAA